MNVDTISAYDKCAQCDGQFHIHDLIICKRCKKVLCDECKQYLAKKTHEINFDTHYCTDNEYPKYGKMVTLYNK